MSLRDRFALVGWGCLTFVVLFGAVFAFSALSGWKPEPGSGRKSLEMAHEYRGVIAFVGMLLAVVVGLVRKWIRERG